MAGSVQLLSLLLDPIWITMLTTEQSVQRNSYPHSHASRDFLSSNHTATRSFPCSAIATPEQLACIIQLHISVLVWALRLLDVLRNYQSCKVHTLLTRAAESAKFKRLRLRLLSENIDSNSNSDSA